MLIHVTTKEDLYIATHEREISLYETHETARPFHF